MATADFSLTAFDNGTVQPGGPRPGSSGKIFFNIEGSANGSFASFGVADFDLSSLAPGFTVVDVVDALTLDIVESNASFTTNGSYSVYFTDAVDISIQFGSPLNYQGGNGVASVDPLLTNLSFLGSFNFVDNGDGSVDTVNLTLTETAEAYIIEQLNDADTDDTLRLVFTPDDPTVAATYAGQGNFDGPAPTLNLTLNSGGDNTANIVINEVDADTPTEPVNDSLEFVELFDGGAGNTPLDGLTVVFFNGNGDVSYQAFDLDGFSTNADGFFVLGNVGVPNVDLVFIPNTLQNGADAVAIYQADAADFPNGTPVTTENLVNAVVYDTNDADDAGLLSLLNPGQPQVNEGGGANGSANDSIQRIPNGTGGARNTDTFQALSPTPGVINQEPVVEPEIKAIYEIQGAGHDSEFEGDLVITTGIVTVVGSFNTVGSSSRIQGFFIQDSAGDGNIATSDAIFVASSASVSIGDVVEVTGIVQEATAQSRELSYTRVQASSVHISSSGNVLPAAVILGEGGRIPPSEIIDDDAFGTIAGKGNFDPETDGLDFFESIEGMLVTAQDAVAIAGTNRFDEIFAVVDGGASASGISQRGTLNINPDDFNPERVQIDFESSLLPGFGFPDVDTGAQLGDVTGVVTYDFGNFQIQPTEAFAVTPADLSSEKTSLVGDADSLTIATYNVLNLDPNDGDGDTDVADGRFDAIAQQIVNNLGTPDIIGLQEVQDNSGSVDNGITAADLTLQTLVDEISAAGGPTYEFIDNTFIDNNVSGGQPGSNIRTAFLYNPSRVSLVDGSVQPIGNQDPGSPFNGARLPLVATFKFNGQEVSVVDNHFSSKGGSAPILGIEQPFDARQEDLSVNGSVDERQAQSTAVQEFVNYTLTNTPGANVVVLGDLNEFEFVSPVVDLEQNTPLTNLTNTLPEDERYSFIFQGNSQSLDHILVSDSLKAGAEFDIVHVNSEFAETDNRASDHDPVIASLELSSSTGFTLELLHTADQEAGIPALDDAPRFSAVLNALKAQDLGNDGIEDNTLVLSSGDAILPGLFFSASEDVFGGAGRADILIQNELGFQAIALGNHEFDLGTGFLAELIAGAEDESFVGAQFPYLSANLDFSTDANLAGLVVADAQAPLPNSLAASTIIDVNGERIGVVGATTPTIDFISSPGGVTIEPTDFDGVPTSEQLDALAASIQADVDALLNANPDINKVVLLAHMQQISMEQELAKRLKNVDIIMAGGSNTRLFDENDRARPGDSNQGPYPIIETDADGKPVAVINTDGNYKYVGRLVIDFDENGVIIPESYDPTVSGAYAADDQGVADLNAESLVDPEIQQIVDELRTVIEAKESNVFGVSEVYLDGTRSSVRTQETNLGNLTADANLAIAREITGDNSIVVSLKNGGGIRDDIGRVIVPPGGTGAPEELPNEGIPGLKPEGGISETDIVNTLRFNNGLTVLDITREGLVAVLEYGVAASSLDDSNTQGRFPQVSSVEFSFDLTQPGGDRVQSAAIKDTDGNILDILVRDGEFVGNPNETVRIVTLNFLAEGGDGYPFPTFGSNYQQLAQPDAAPRTGDATFAPDGSEQDAFAEYLFDNFFETPFDEVDTERDLDQRLQNLAFREDTVLPANDKPVARDDSFSTDEDTRLSGNVLDNDRSPDGDNLSVTVVNGNSAAVGTRIILASGAKLTVNADGSFSYKPDDDDVTDTFTYEVSDGNGGTDTATVTITVLDDVDDDDDNDDGDDIGDSSQGGKILTGGLGRDVLFGGEGNDAINGNRGNDVLFGGEGDDLLDGGAGRDVLFGGEGSNTFVLALGEGTDTIVDFEVGVDFIGLADGLSFGSLSLTQNNGGVSISAGNESLANVDNITVGALNNEVNFISNFTAA